MPNEVATTDNPPTREEFNQLKSEVAALQDAFEALQAVVEALAERIAPGERLTDAFMEGFEEGRPQG